jgi:hypothetical protein
MKYIRFAESRPSGHEIASAWHRFFGRLLRIQTRLFVNLDFAGRAGRDLSDLPLRFEKSKKEKTKETKGGSEEQKQSAAQGSFVVGLNVRMETGWRCRGHIRVGSREVFPGFSEPFLNFTWAKCGNTVIAGRFTPNGKSHRKFWRRSHLQQD